MVKRITIIGAGPGGYSAAFDVAKHGAQVTLIESTWLGGTCLNCGCIPTKTLKASAEAFETVCHAQDFGISIDGSFKIDMPTVINRKKRVTDTLRGGLEKTCAQLKINLIYGVGKVINASLVEVTKNDGSVEKVDSDAVIIATGSSTLNLPNLLIDHKFILSSDDALELDHVPSSLIIVGGGVIGCELAFIYQAFGSKVTLVEGLDRVLPVPSVDEEMSKIIQREMKKASIKVELCRTVQKCEILSSSVKAHIGASPFLTNIPVTAQKDDILEASAVIVAVGRVPNTQGLGLEDANIETDTRGFIVVNEYLETNVSGIFAIGDVLGPAKIMLAHMAVMEGLIVAQNCLSMTDKKAVDYSIVPSGIFVSPEVGTVGLTENQAKEQGFDVSVSLVQFRELGKAQAMGALPGVFKLIADKKNGKLLGAHIAGAHATDLIAELTLALQLGATIEDIAKTIHPHPTLSEGIFEAAHRME